MTDLFLPPEIALKRIDIIVNVAKIIKDVANIVNDYECVILKPGYKVNCMDTHGRVYHGVVLELRGENETYYAYIHYHLWSNVWNEWVQLYADNFRITPYNRNKATRYQGFLSPPSTASREEKVNKLLSLGFTRADIEAALDKNEEHASIETVIDDEFFDSNKWPSQIDLLDY